MSDELEELKAQMTARAAESDWYRLLVLFHATNALLRLEGARARRDVARLEAAAIKEMEAGDD